MKKTPSKWFPCFDCMFHLGLRPGEECARKCHLSIILILNLKLPVEPPVAETACDRIKQCKLPASVDGPVVCVEGSDMMGLNLHRGVQGGRHDL